MTYLLEHPNPYHLAGTPHWYATRRGGVLAIVVHITAGLEDLDATDDHSAENTARYAATTDRKVSWHSGSDADSALDLLPAGYTAFHVQGYNSTTYGHEVSKADTDWRDAPEPWRTRTLTNAAQHLAAKASQLDVPRRHATRAELDHAIATGGGPVGFIGHHELDPARRSDPGLVRGVDTFPWDDFFALMGATPQPVHQEDDDDMASYIVRRKGSPDVYLIDAGKRFKFNSEAAVKTVCDERPEIRHAGRVATGPRKGIPNALEWTGYHVDLYPPGRTAKLDT